LWADLFTFFDNLTRRLCEQETNKKGGKKKRILFSFQGRKGRPVNDGVIALIDWGTFYFFLLLFLAAHCLR
jgi:hypothetical protein